MVSCRSSAVCRRSGSARLPGPPWAPLLSPGQGAGPGQDRVVTRRGWPLTHTPSTWWVPCSSSASATSGSRPGGQAQPPAGEGHQLVEVVEAEPVRMLPVLAVHLQPGGGQGGHGVAGPRAGGPRGRGSAATAGPGRPAGAARSARRPPGGGRGRSGPRRTGPGRRRCRGRGGRRPRWPGRPGRPPPASGPLTPSARTPRCPAGGQEGAPPWPAPARRPPAARLSWAPGAGWPPPRRRRRPGRCRRRAGTGPPPGSTGSPGATRPARPATENSPTGNPHGDSGAEARISSGIAQPSSRPAPPLQGVGCLAVHARQAALTQPIISRRSDIRPCRTQCGYW